MSSPERIDKNPKNQQRVNKTSPPKTQSHPYRFNESILLFFNIDDLFIFN